RGLTPEELARAIRIDPRQIKGLGPSLDALMAILQERKRKILATYETETVQEAAGKRFHDQAGGVHPPGKLARPFQEAVRDEQLPDLEQLWYRAGDEGSKFSRQLLHLVESLGDKYQIDELAAKYEFTGRTPMTIPQALEIKRELETIDKLLKQLEEAMKTAQIGIIDLEELAQFAEPGEMQQLADLQRQINEYLQHLAQEQGLQQTRSGFQMTPRAYRLFQNKLLTQIFEQLDASRSG